MKHFLIVGGGFTGMVTANILKRNAKTFVGLEKLSYLGGGDKALFYRRYEREASIQYLSGLFPSLTWKQEPGKPSEWAKNKWIEVPSTTGSKGLENPFSLENFFETQLDVESYLELLATPVEKDFKLNTRIVSFNPTEKVVLCSDGAELGYKHLLWCASLRSLMSACPVSGGELSKVSKALKKSSFRRVTLEHRLTKAVFPNNHTLLFPFRYKAQSFKALGTSGLSKEPSTSSQDLRWSITLPEDGFEDREEIAKLIRAFRRELEKDFTDLRTQLSYEKTVYLPNSSEDPFIPLNTLNLLEGVTYVGQSGVSEDFTEDSSFSTGADILAANLARFESTLGDKK